MFLKRYFASRFFPLRYFAEQTGIVPPVVLPASVVKLKSSYISSLQIKAGYAPTTPLLARFNPSITLRGNKND